MKSLTINAIFALFVVVLTLGFAGNSFAQDRTSYDGIQDTRLEKLENRRRGSRKPSPLPGKVKALETEVKELGTNAGEMQKDIDQNTANIEKLDKNVHTIDDKVKNIENRSDNSRLWLWIISGIIAVIIGMGVWYWFRISAARTIANAAQQTGAQNTAVLVQHGNDIQQLNTNIVTLNTRVSNIRDASKRRDRELRQMVRQQGLGLAVEQGRITHMGTTVAANSANIQALQVGTNSVTTQLAQGFQVVGSSANRGRIGDTVTISVTTNVPIRSASVNGAPATMVRIANNGVLVTIPNTAVGNQFIVLHGQAGSQYVPFEVLP